MALQPATRRDPVTEKSADIFDRRLLAPLAANRPTGLLRRLGIVPSRSYRGYRPVALGRAAILDRSMETETSSAKDKVRALLDRLPNECSLDDVLYHLYVIRAVEQGLQDAAAGRVLSQEEVTDQLRQKWQVGRAG